MQTDTDKRPKILKFKATFERPMEAYERFYPGGRQLLNQTEWRGKEPRSCAVTKLSGRHSGPSNGAIEFDLEVTYKPKGFISFVGGTKYDGWTAMLLDKKQDGTLLDGHGQPLPSGSAPVYLPFEVYSDTEFNALDFGTFVGESDLSGIEVLPFEQVMKDFENSDFVSGGIDSRFIAPRRQRPFIRIVISESDLVPGPSDSVTRIVMLNKLAPQFEHTLVEHLYEAMTGFLEGRYSLKTLSNSQSEFVEIGNSLMEVKKQGDKLESVFDVEQEYLRREHFEELAKRLTAIYEVNVDIVEGKRRGLLLRRPPETRRSS